MGPARALPPTPAPTPTSPAPSPSPPLLLLPLVLVPPLPAVVTLPRLPPSPTASPWPPPSLSSAPPPWPVSLSSSRETNATQRSKYHSESRTNSLLNTHRSYHQGWMTLSVKAAGQSST